MRPPRARAKRVQAMACRGRWDFFFSSRRRHTRFDCDWSSDVCSSDLICATAVDAAIGAGAEYADARAVVRRGQFVTTKNGRVEQLTDAESQGIGVRVQIGRASGRGRGEISGGAGSLKKKKRRNYSVSR